jgi:ADP-ribosyl-[dinitrogen reductase] hydrolase
MIFINNIKKNSHKDTKQEEIRIIPPYNGALQINSLNGPNGSILGLTNCPGRNHRSAGGEIWGRNLLTDLKAIEDWKADALITLNESEEFSALGVPEFESVAVDRKFEWFHLPIDDFGVPGANFNTAWDQYGSTILNKVNSGARLIIHCAYGLGRSGTFAAKILTTFGIKPTAAIKQVRDARPGAIESQVQVQYILNNLSLE